MKWTPITDIDPGAKNWPSELYRQARDEWQRLRAMLTDRASDTTALELWNTERNRLMAIETGQIEDLYTIRRGITEQLITEGLEHARASHTIEQGLPDETLRGLLEDQHDALEMVFQCVNERPLSESVIKEWHALLTRHQELAPARDAQGRPTGIPFTKGGYKRRPNNPRRPDGIVHEYCPPEHTASEMERLIALHHEHEKNPLPTPVEAAWLHHRFVQIHPFEDGNGRTARLLMSYVYIKRNEPPPIITAAEKPDYIRVLEAADAGDLSGFARFLELKSIQTLDSSNRLAQSSLEAAGRFHHMNGNISTQNGHRDWTHHRHPDNEELGTGAERARPTREEPSDASEETMKTLCQAVTDRAVEAIAAADELDHTADSWTREELTAGRPRPGAKGLGSTLAKERMDRAAAGLQGGSESITGTRERLRREARKLRADAMDDMCEELIRHSRGRLVGDDAMDASDIRAAFGQASPTGAAERMEAGAKECDRLSQERRSEGEVDARTVLPRPETEGAAKAPSASRWAEYGLAVATAPAAKLSPRTLAATLRDGAASLRERASKQQGKETTQRPEDHRGRR